MEQFSLNWPSCVHGHHIECIWNLRNIFRRKLKSYKTTKSKWTAQKCFSLILILPFKTKKIKSTLYETYSPHKVIFDLESDKFQIWYLAGLTLLESRSHTVLLNHNEKNLEPDMQPSFSKYFIFTFSFSNFIIYLSRKIVIE